jgi:hypothetical protein
MAITLPGTGQSVATEDIGGDDYQLLKLVDGTATGTDRIPGTAARGLSVDPRRKVVRLSQTPTVSSGAIYAAKDAIGALLTFANAARASGGSIVIDAVQIVDKGQQMRACDLVLFDRTFTAPTDNAAFDPTDAELATCIGVIPISPSDYADFTDNSVATRDRLGLAAVLNGTDLFGVLVARATPTYTSTSDIIITVTIYQD